MNRYAVSTFVASLFLMGALAGCGEGNPKTAPVEGTVTYKGNPVVDADVSFWGQGASRAGIGKTDAAGKYQISTFGTNDGALLGSNKVTVSKSAPAMTAADMTSGKKAAPIVDPVPAKYAAATNTPLTAEVKPGPNKFDFTLED